MEQGCDAKRHAQVVASVAIAPALCGFKWHSESDRLGRSSSLVQGCAPTSSYARWLTLVIWLLCALVSGSHFLRGILGRASLCARVRGLIFRVRRIR